VLYESRAIARYIATKYAAQCPALVPTGLQDVARLEQAVSIEQNNFCPPIYQIFREKVVNPCVLKLFPNIYLAIGLLILLTIALRVTGGKGQRRMKSASELA
jgi:hypothetical protein